LYIWQGEEESSPGGGLGWKRIIGTGRLPGINENRKRLQELIKTKQDCQGV